MTRLRTLPLLLGLSVLLVGCSKKPAPAEKNLTPYVTVAAATSQNVPLFIDAIGNVTAFNTVNIIPRVSGQIMATHFTEGMIVKQNDLLFTIDPRPYQATLDQSVAQLEQSKIQLIYDKYKVQSYTGLLKDQFVSKLDFEQYVTDAGTAQAQVEQNRAAVEANKLNLEFCWIASPITGKTGKQLIDTGNIVYADQSQPLVVINQLQPIYIDFSIPEKLFSELRPFLNSSELTVQITLPEDDKQIYDAKLVFINNMIEPSTGTMPLRAQYPNDHSELWPGQYVKVRIILKTIPDAVLVPLAAIQVNTKGPYVFIVGKDMKVQQKQVKLGQRYENFQLVLDGVNTGDSVVTGGQMSIKDGSQVKVKSS